MGLRVKSQDEGKLAIVNPEQRSSVVRESRHLSQRRIPDTLSRVNPTSPSSSNSTVLKAWPPYQKCHIWKPEAREQNTAQRTRFTRRGIWDLYSRICGIGRLPDHWKRLYDLRQGCDPKSHALDLSCSDGSFPRDQGATAAISRSRYIKYLKSLDC